MFQAWGKEQKFYSIENIDHNKDEWSKKHSLSARLRQCFDFMAQKVFAVVFKNDDKFFTNQNMVTIGTFLVQQIYKVVFGKLSNYVQMHEEDVVRSSAQRD